MIRFRSPLISRFNYCSRFSNFRYLFFLYKLFFNSCVLWTLFNTLVLRKHLWVRFVKRNYVYYLRSLNSLKWTFCSYKRFFYLIQSSIFPMFHVLFSTVSTVFSFLLNRLFWLLFYFQKIKVHFFFIVNLVFPSIIFINNRTNLILKKATLFSWSSGFLFNYFFSKMYRAFNFRFFVVSTYHGSRFLKPTFSLALVSHHWNLIRRPQHVNYFQFLHNFLITFFYFSFFFLLETYVFVQRLLILFLNPCI